MMQNGLLKSEDPHEQLNNSEESTVANVKSQFTFNNKVDVSRAKNKIFKLAHAFNTIKRLGLMRIVNGMQFGNEIFNNKE